LRIILEGEINHQSLKGLNCCRLLVTRWAAEGFIMSPPPHLSCPVSAQLQLFSKDDLGLLLFRKLWPLGL
jgi:hypothetical protein